MGGMEHSRITMFQTGGCPAARWNMGPAAMFLPSQPASYSCLSRIPGLFVGLPLIHAWYFCLVFCLCSALLVGGGRVPALKHVPFACVSTVRHLGKARAWPKAPSKTIALPTAPMARGATEVR